MTPREAARGRLAFMDPLVLAIMDDSKTVTRRLTAPRFGVGAVVDVCEALTIAAHPTESAPFDWVSYRCDGLPTLRKTGTILMDLGREAPVPTDTFECVPWPWKVRVLPARYCPGWAVRTRVEVVDVRREPLSAITDADAIREGIARLDGFADDAAVCRAAKAMGACIDDPRACFVAAYRALHRLPDDADPLLYRIGFRRLA